MAMVPRRATQRLLDGTGRPCDGERIETPEPASDAGEQWRRRREAASRCEPFDCGHRDPLDCTKAGCGEQADTESASPAPEPVVVEPGDFAQLWADAKAVYFTQGYPKYGSQAWQALHPDDPKRLASALHAAECWRKYGDEQELCDWLKRLSSSPEAVLRARALAERDALAQPKPPHQLRATPRWPAVAVPGRPGVRRHLINGKQADIPDHNSSEYAA